MVWWDTQRYVHAALVYYMHTTMDTPPTIIKMDGSKEPFARGKLLSSLKRSGADSGIAQEIADQIETELAEDMTTGEIYRRARTLLKKYEKTTAARYSLRRALFDLGPTGFPFEYFLARLFAAQGYTTERSVVMRGACAEHEIDLVASKADSCLIAEAKFHSRAGTRSDMQVVLYSYARFLDLKDVKPSDAHACGVVDTYVITNTKFTRSAIDYAECVGVKLLSWNYPKTDNLQDHIERAGIYPITTLPSLSMKEKRLLLEHGVVLCRDVGEKRDVLRSLGLSAKKIETIVEESVNLCTAK